MLAVEYLVDFLSYETEYAHLSGRHSLNPSGHIDRYVIGYHEVDDTATAVETYSSQYADERGCQVRELFDPRDSCDLLEVAIEKIAEIVVLSASKSRKDGYIFVGRPLQLGCHTD